MYYKINQGFMMKKIIIKISSNLLNPDNKTDILENLASEIFELRKQNYKIIIVTSGAVMHGVKLLGLDKKPESLPLLQSCAAIGQITLMSRYQRIFKEFGLIPGQILVSIDDFKTRNRYLNLRNATESLLEIGAIPVFNENDSINIEELKFGDNDQLSSIISLMMDFHRLIILTDVDGFYDKNPKEHKDAKLLRDIEKIDDKLLENITDEVSKFTSGGMRKKIESAGRASKAGVEVFIGNGYKISLLKIIDGSETGTYIHANTKKVNAKKKWLGFSPSENGSVVIDQGAFNALTKRNSSLLASGITDVKGNFPKGSLINIIFEKNKIAQGLSNYSSKDLSLIKGKKSNEFVKYLKTCDYEEVIHKNNLFIL
jgi:glutamate 5-kinase